MSSLIAWLDHDEEDRRRMREAVALLSEEGAVDELGLGRIRDAISERIFPGTSVLWRRARYLLFVPWVYELLAEGQGKPGSADQRASRLFQRLARNLAENEPPGSGVIGASGVAVKQPPDTLMWAALRSWGVCVRPASLGHAREEAVSRSLRRVNLEVDGDPTGSTRWWPQVVGLRPSRFPDGARMALEPSEAEAIEQLLLAEDTRADDTSPAGAAALARRDSLLAHIIRRRELPPEDLMPWQIDLTGASDELAEALRHAGCFSDVIHGARIRYAGLVAQARDDEALAAWADAEGKQWVDTLSGTRAKQLRRWGADLREFWRLVRTVNPNIGRERHFVQSWTAAALDDPGAALKSTRTRALVIEQERQAKTAKKARLTPEGGISRDADARAPARFSYRWSQGRQIAHDILEGLDP